MTLPGEDDNAGPTINNMRHDHRHLSQCLFDRSWFDHTRLSVERERNDDPVAWCLWVSF